MSKDLPLVSMVIPAYNLAPYLDEAIQSVLKQDYANVELIVLDDGSTDHTREVLEKYTGRFHWETHENMGQASTLNEGWQLSKGEIQAYLSADDALLPNAVSTSIRCLMEHPEFVMVYCDFNLIDPNSRIIRRVNAPEVSYHDMVVKNICAPGPGAFFRREGFEAVGMWNPHLKRAPDYEFWLKLGRKGYFRRIPEVLASLRVHADSLSFARVDPYTAEEPVRIMSAYFCEANVPAAIKASEGEALSNAHLISSRVHLRSNRYGAAASHLWQALKLHSKNLVAKRTLRLLANGLFNRVGHRIWWGVRSLKERVNHR
jgi:glycosyltransferase involved in cell wall biosynthesis